MSGKYNTFFIAVFFALFLTISCSKKDEKPTYPQTARHDRIPADAVKITPDTDLHPPVLYSDEYEQAVPLGPEINTAGAEDSPFIPADRNELYFFFTPDVDIPVEQQVNDEVTGIYTAKQHGGNWFEAKRVWLQDPGKLALDGAEFVEGDTMLFVSAREGYTGLHWFRAVFDDGNWSRWQIADFEPSFEVGELHITNNKLYYHSSKSGGAGKSDIWMLTNLDGTWQNPTNVLAVNTAENESHPYVTPDDTELWFTRTYEGTPAIFRSVKENNEWQEPELIVSQFAGEPTLDQNRNLYFVHHFYKNGQMIEADIYIARKK